jgi:uncharacterized protein (TIGR02246 family)
MKGRRENAASIRRLERNWSRAWNSHNTRELTALLTRDADFVTVGGDWLRGRKEFQRYHALLHATIFKHSLFTVTGTTIRFLGSDLALTHVKWRLVGDFNTDGTPRKPRRGIFTQVLLRSNGRWCILASHNTNRRPPLGKSVVSRLRQRDWK